MSANKHQTPESSRQGPAGRFHAEAALDWRTDAQRDRDRILYSAPFARLAETTQVTSPERGHVFHNRLTHSLKVGQIARRISERLGAKHRSLVEQCGGADPDAAEAAGLAHDLGHPPFGHIAEQELNTLVESEGVADGFEGNAQSFRIIAELAGSDAQDRQGLPIRGLNASRQLLNGILKYPWAHGESPEHPKKWGYYSTESDVFTWAREGMPSHRRSLIAEIMDWADDLTFAIHDLLDFFSAGRIPIDRCKPEGSVERQRILDGMFSRNVKWSKERTEYEAALDSIVEQFPFDADDRFTGCRADSQKLFKFSTGLIGRYVNVFVDSFEASAAKWERQSVEIDAQVRREIEVLKQFTWEYVILDPLLSVPQRGQRKAIRTVFECLLNAARKGDAHLFPARFRGAAQDADVQGANIRNIADCIASMTERELIHFYRSLDGAWTNRD